MLKNLNKMINITAQSSVDETSENILYMTGSIDQAGKVTLNKYIQNYDLYKENKETCDKDYSEFESTVYTYVIE